MKKCLLLILFLLSSIAYCDYWEINNGFVTIYSDDGTRSWSMSPNDSETNINWIWPGSLGGIGQTLTSDGSNTLTWGVGMSSTLTDGGILIGNGTGPITALSVATNGQIPIGDGVTDPVLATITGNTGIDVTNGAGSITLDFDSTEISDTTWGFGTDFSWTADINGTNPVITFSDDLVSVAGSLGITSEYTLPLTDGGSGGQIIKTDGGGTLAWVTPTMRIPIIISMYDGVPTRNTVSDWNGGIIALDTGASLGPTTPGDDLALTKGTGKILLIVNDGGGDDMVGDITITGTSVDMTTGATTGADTDTITLVGATVDNSTTAGKGNAITVHDFDNAYISTKWFTGAVVLSSTEVTLTDLDVYHASYCQFNNAPNVKINTFTGTIFTTNVNAEFDAYLFTLHKDDGDVCHVDNETSIHVGTEGETALVNKHWSLRRGGIAEHIDGRTGGFWVEIFYLNNPTYVEDVTLKLWATQSTSLTFGAASVSNLLLETGNNALLENGDIILLEL